MFCLMELQAAILFGQAHNVCTQVQYACYVLFTYKIMFHSMTCPFALKDWRLVSGKCVNLIVLGAKMFVV